MKTISINGHILNSALLVDAPDIKRTAVDASGQQRHIRSFSHPGRLRNYLEKHPEGMILAGIGSSFFREPVPVSSAMVRFDECGNADIRIRDGAEQIEKQLSAIEAIRAAASEQL